MKLSHLTKTAVTTATKPRNTVDIISAVVAMLTVLAALPYELGDVATLIPASWKGYVATIGVFSTLALRIIRLFMASTTPPPVAPAVKPPASP